MKRICLALVVILLATAPAGAQGFCGSMFRAAEAASRNGGWDRAAEYLSQTITCLGGDTFASVPPYYARGMINLTLERNMESAADFQTAIERELRFRKTAAGFPPRGRIHLGWTRLYRALALLSAGQYRDALADFEQAARQRDIRDPLSPHIDPRFRQFNFPLDRVFSGMSLEAAAIYGRGVTKLRLGDTAGGNADLAFAVRMNPEIRARMSGLAPAP